VFMCVFSSSRVSGVFWAKLALRGKKAPLAGWGCPESEGSTDLKGNRCDTGFVKTPFGFPFPKAGFIHMLTNGFPGPFYDLSMTLNQISMAKCIQCIHKYIHV